VFIKEAFYVLFGFYWEKRSREKIEKHQINKINNFLKDACSNVPYYINSKIYSKQIASFDDFRKLPVMNKDIVRSSSDSFHSKKYCDLNKLIALRTSGTTGEPMTFYHDINCYSYFTGANVRKVMSTKKYKPYFKAIQISPHIRKPKIYEKFGLFRRITVSGDLPIDEVKKIVIESKPDCLISYPVYLGDLVSSMSEEERNLLSESVKLIFTESEMLTENLRAYIQNSLKTEIFDDYASNEMLSITYECSHHRHHIVEDRIYLEVLDDEGNSLPDNIEGNIVITSYLEKAMPLIRYLQGDKGIISSEPCPCGRTFKTLKLTQGRAEHCIQLDNGKKIYSWIMIRLSVLVEGVREMYIRQGMDGNITVYYIPFNKVHANNNEIERFIKDYFIDELGICPKLEVTDCIPRTKGGKAQYIFSEISEKELIARA